MKYLRAIEPEDLDVMYILENDPIVSRHTSTTVPLSRYALKQYILESQNDIFKDTQVRLAIVDPKNNNNLCGFLDITDFVPQHSRAQIGIATLPDTWGRGIATEALTEASVYAKQQGVRMLYAVLAEDNLRARSLFLKAGYKETATLQSWLLVGDIFYNAILYQKKID